MRNYKMIRRIGVFAVLLMAIAAVSISRADDAKKKETTRYQTGNTGKFEVLTNRHTQYTQVEEAVGTLTTEGFEEKMNNGTLAVWYNEDMEALRIVDLRSGYIWGCIDDKEEYNLNKKWRARATSMCYITYFDFQGKEESCALSESPFKAKYKWEDNRFSCDVSAKKLGLSFTFTGSLEGNRLIFAMEDKSIQETGKSKLSRVSFMSFIGSVYEDTIPGYMLIPDGSGALIRFQKAEAYQSGYSRKVYGNDVSIDKDISASNLNGNRTDDYATDENQLSLPLWGMVHGENQNGFLATIDSGELYTEINAIPAGAGNQTVKFSRAYADFVYRCQYDKRISNSKVITVPQEEMNAVNPKLSFTFLVGENASYSGMANVYREQLLKNKTLPENKIEEEGDISLFLHIAASEVKKGFFSNGLAELTDAEQTKAILEKLKKAGITDISMTLSGWNKGGYHGASYGTTKFEKKVGNKKEIAELRDLVEKQGGKFSLTLNLVKANQDQIRVKQDAALNATLNAAQKTIPNKSLMYQTSYFLGHEKMMKALDKSLSDLEEYDLLLEDLGKYLYADYTIGEEITRDRVKEEIENRMEKAKQSVILDAENLYLVKYVSEIVNVPVSSSQYIYETDSVPFLQMVLRGSVDYFGPYSNQGFYSDASILKMIEYGAYPSFIVMGADNFSLNDTPLENHFSLNFNDWEDKILNVYDKVNGALSNVKGQAITSHSVEAEGVYCTSYENGVDIYVNYNDEDYVTAEGITVPAGGYTVEEQR